MNLIFLCILSASVLCCLDSFRINRICNKNLYSFQRTNGNTNKSLRNTKSIVTLKNTKPDQGVSPVMKLLPVLSIVLSVCGIAFQVFVLYPWHEELSYEFKDLEQSIIRLDRSLQKLDPSLEDISAFNRITDKYTQKQDVWKAGPKISKFLPVLDEEEKKLIDQSEER